MTREVERNQALQNGNGFLNDYETGVLNQVGKRYEQVQAMQEKITGTEGTHEAMQLMNSQMNATEYDQPNAGKQCVSGQACYLRTQKTLVAQKRQSIIINSGSRTTSRPTPRSATNCRALNDESGANNRYRREEL